MTHYAHSVKGRPEEEWEHLIDHLRDVGRLASELASPFKAETIADALGVLHDIGKVHPDMIRRYRGEPVKVDHSTAGAVLAIQKYGPILGKMLAFSIAGHHTGLANGAAKGIGVTPLKERLDGFEMPVIPPGMDLSPSFADICAGMPLPMSLPGFTAAFSKPFMIRMLFSCLADADFLQTERFYQEEVKGCDVDRGCYETLAGLSVNLAKYLSVKSAEATPTPVNALRAKVLAQALDRAQAKPGVFTLTVPTGGGKTLTSAAFALRHAAANKSLRRVIYVIPFTSIIEQTADVLRRALGSEDSILEHHSAFDVEKHFSDDDSGERKLRLDSQNWDRPVVVTTAVQFFESLFANRTSRCRKLHNIVNSVIVIDEAQVMPLRMLRPCVEALKELVRGYGCTVVLCTATQPALNAADGFGDGFADVTEIAPDPADLNRQLKRVDLVVESDTMSDQVLAARLLDKDQVMCILNTKRHVRDVYNLISDQPGATHLSTSMCAAHRRHILDEIRQDLIAGKPVRLVSTSLIEAGVDISFPEVWRAIAGLDSIIQAAGRCNREGELPHNGTVHVFQPEDADGHRPPHDLAQFAEVASTVLGRHADNPINLDSIREYFGQVYWRRGADLDGALVGEPPLPGILRALRVNADTGDYPFADIAAAFRMIDSHDIPLIVPYGDFQQAVDELVASRTVGRAARRLQQFIVQVSPRIRQRLIDDGHAEVIREGDLGNQFVLLTNPDLYSEAVGLTI